MRKLITPDLILKHYSEFDANSFYDKGYRTIFIDLDNTIGAYYDKTISSDAKAFLENMQKIGFKVFVVSNNNAKRVGNFLNSTNIEYVYYSMKPLPKGYYKLLNKYKNINKKEVIMIGDQMLTDVLGANIMGFLSIWVKPIVDKDSYTTKLSRKIETFLFKYVVKNEKM